jgi:protein SCO1/2
VRSEIAKQFAVQCSRLSSLRHKSFLIGSLGFLLFLANQCGGSAKRYPLAGKIIAIDHGKHQLVVSHSEISGYMPAMVMPFQIKDANAFSSLSKGDEIVATLVVSGSQSWLEDLRVTRKSNGGADARDTEIRALPKVGDAVPDFVLTNQDGKRISLKEYRGKALLITFIYTRCPLPDYCPLMSSNFAQIEKTLQQDQALSAKTHLLSISFDWEHDTPAVLRSYGAAYTGKFSDEKFEHWEFASGSSEEVNAIAEFFGLQYESKPDQIVHSLVTAIISPEGKIAKVYSGNEWRPADVLSDLRAMKL